MNILYCSECGKKLVSYDRTSFRRYKSPVKSCKKCGSLYIDPRFHEIAVEGIPSDVFSVKSYIVLIILGILLLWRGIYVLHQVQLGVPDEVQWLMPAVILLCGAGFVIGGIAEIISIKTGLKKKKYDRLYLESAERLKNADYADTLRNLGVDIPENKENL
ncbi:MAG: hypothetical protein NC489_03235 [Ruminococcus flavefaciens]|nr:hypothetical protein [Ruminococcus flavefaciens]